MTFELFGIETRVSSEAQIDFDRYTNGYGIRRGIAAARISSLQELGRVESVPGA